MNAEGFEANTQRRRRRRYFALSMIGLAALVGLVFAELLRRASVSELPELPDLSGQPPALVDHLRQADRAARRDPTSAESVGALGMAYHADTFTKHAARCYQLAVAASPDDWRWHYYLALLEEAAGETDAVAETLGRVLELRPTLAVGWWRLGNALWKKGAYRDAEEAYGKAVALDRASSNRAENPTTSPPGSRTLALAAYASYGLARVAVEQDDLEAAREILEGLTLAEPRFGAGHRLLGSVYHQLGLPREAETSIARASKCGHYLPPADSMIDVVVRQSRHSGLLLKQLIIAARSKNARWAEYLARRAVEVNNADTGAVAELGLLLLGLGQADEALVYLDRYRAARRDDASKLTKIAYSLAVNGRLGNAIDFLRDALRVDPHFVGGWKRFGKVVSRFAAGHAKAGRLEEAVEALEQAIEFAVTNERADLAERFRSQLEHYLRGSSRHQGVP